MTSPESFLETQSGFNRMSEVCSFDMGGKKAGKVSFANGEIGLALPLCGLGFKIVVPLNLP